MKNHQSIIKICFAFIFLIYAISGQVTWTPILQIKTGQIILYDDVYLSVSAPTLYSATFSSAFASSTSLSYGVSVCGFENYLSYYMSFNVTVNSITASSIVVKYISIQSTYFRQLYLNYIVKMPTLIQVHYGCFLCLDLINNYGPRYQLFSNQTTGIIISAAPALNVISGISGMNLYNPIGDNNILSTNSWVNIGETKLYHNVSVEQNNTLQFICLTSVIINTQGANVFQYNVVYQMNKYYVNENNTVDDIVVNNAFQGDDARFYGIAGFNFFMGGSRMYLFDTSNITEINSTLQSNQFAVQIKLQALYIAWRNCNPNTDFYIVDNFTCDPACSALQNTAISTNKLCFQCLDTCNGCVTTYTTCSDCYVTQFRVLNSSTNSCDCNITGGYFQNGNIICDKCITYLDGCEICVSASQCMQCMTGYVLNNQTFKCGCDPGFYLASGLCLPYPGCLQAYSILTGVYCQTCDTVNKFQIDTTTNYSCTCMRNTFFNSSNTTCEDNCGDGLTTSILGSCDDGNTISGDGCSSTCFIQTGYTCTYDHTTGGISTCGLDTVLSIAYLFSERVLTSDQAKIYFQLSPSQPFLSTTAFANSLTIDSPYSSKLVEFDPLTSQIIVTLNYNKDMQGQSYSATFTFSGMSISSPDITIPFTAIGLNARLTIDQNPSQNLILYYVGMALGSFALVVAIACSILGQKMMGIELILPIQATFFILSAASSQSPPALVSLSSLRYSNGYNVIQTFSLVQNYLGPSQISRLQYFNEYICNYNLMFLIIVFNLIVLLIIYFRRGMLNDDQQILEEKIQQIKEQKRNIKNGKQIKVLKLDFQEEEEELNSTNQSQVTPKQQENQNSAQMDELMERIKRWKNLFSNIIQKFYVMFIVTQYLQVIFALMAQTSNISSQVYPFDIELNSCFLILSETTIILGLYFIIFDYKSQRTIAYNCNKDKIAIYYLLIFLMFIIFLGATFQSSFSIYFMAMFGLFPIILILYQVPYELTRTNFNTFVALICQLPFLISTTKCLISKIMDPIQEQMSYIFAYIIIGIIAISTILTIIRLIKQVDFKKLVIFDFFVNDQDTNNKDKKRNNNITLLEMDIDGKWADFQLQSVRGAYFSRKRKGIDWQNRALNEYESIKNIGINQKKDQFNKYAEQDNDEDIDQLERVKRKLRRQLKERKIQGKIK